MKNNRTWQINIGRINIGLAFGLLAFMPALAAAERLILTDDDYAVFRLDERCGDTVDLQIQTERPALFRDDSKALTSLVTTARAIISYECPDLSTLRLVGVHKESGTRLFEGMTGDRNDWRVTTRYRDARVDGDNLDDLTSRYTVAGLTVGMSLEDARATLIKEFGQDGVRYNDWDRTLSAGNEDCPTRSGRRAADNMPAGARCIRARFEPGQPPKLISMRLLQSVEGDQMSTGISALQDRYGRPDFSERREPRQRQRDAGFSNTLHLGWGETFEARRRNRNATRHQLEADLTTSGRATLLLMRLARPDTENTTEDGRRDSVFGF